VNDGPILIVGCPRSGTTLLRDLLRAHPRITFPLESRVIPELYRGHGEPRDRAHARRIAADLLGTWDIETWRLGLDPAELDHHRSFAELTAQLYATWAKREGKPRWGDKTPMYVLELDTLLSLFPSAQVINVVRDGRDVGLSMMRQLWGPTNPYTAALMWRRTVAAGRRAAARLPSSVFLSIAYERLLSDPVTELRRICDFLGESFAPEMLTPSRLPTPSGRPNPWPPHRELAIDSGNAGLWRTEMSAVDRSVFESVAGEELRLAGYALSSKPCRLRLRERGWWHAQDAIHWLYWRLTTWDRRARARTTVILVRARLTGILRRPSSIPRRTSSVLRRP
jgi:sulfotransferase family protein